MAESMRRATNRLDSKGVSEPLLAIPRKRRILDTGWVRGIDDVAEFDAEVLKVAFRDGVFEKFFDDRLEVG